MHTPAENTASNGEKVVPGCKAAARRGRMLVVGEALCGQETSDALAGWMDMDVETAENDRIASILATMSLIEDRPYEAVLIDVQMPDASGLEAARWLRRHGWLGPIIATGDAAGNEARKRSLEAGCEAFIDKPLSNEKLKAAYAEESESDVETPPAVASSSETPPSNAARPRRRCASAGCRGCPLHAGDHACLFAEDGD